MQAIKANTHSALFAKRYLGETKSTALSLRRPEGRIELL
jgi:hypothetical protein